MQIPVDKVLPNPEQPRTIFDEVEMQQLAGTIKSHGLIQAIIVDRAPDGYYILIEGERRLRAHKMNGMKTIRAEIREETTGDVLELALISNLQRSDMGPVDEARAYKKLVSKYKSAAEVSRRIGVNAMAIGMRLALLDLPEEVQRIYNTKAITTHANVLRALKNLPDDLMIKVASTAASRGWTGQVIISMAGLALQRLTNPQKKKSKQETPVEPEKKPAAPVKVDPPAPTKPHQFNTYVLDPSGHFNALAMVGNRNYLPQKAIDPVLETCQECPLYREAGPKICGQCPMVAYLNKLVVEIRKGT